MNLKLLHNAQLHASFIRLTQMAAVAEHFSFESVAKAKKSSIPYVLGASTGFGSRNSVIYVTVILWQNKNELRRCL